jgi:hypothetical protein
VSSLANIFVKGIFLESSTTKRLQTQMINTAIFAKMSLFHITMLLEVSSLANPDRKPDRSSSKMERFIRGNGLESAKRGMASRSGRMVPATRDFGTKIKHAERASFIMLTEICTMATGSTTKQTARALITIGAGPFFADFGAMISSTDPARKPILMVPNT